MTACSLAAMQVTQSSASTAAMTMTTTMVTTAGKKTSADDSVTRPMNAGSSSKRASSQSVKSHTKGNKQRSSKPPSMQKQQSMQQQQQPHPPSAPSTSSSYVVSYAGAVKSSPSLQDKKSSSASKPVAYVKPTSSTATAPSLPEQQEDTTEMTTDTLSGISSFPTAHLSQELMVEENLVTVSTVEDQPKQVVVTKSEPTVVVPPSFVPPVISKSSSSAATAPVSTSTHLSSFAPFTFVAAPSTTVTVVMSPVTTVTSTAVSNPEQLVDEESGKEGITEVEGVASKRIRLGGSTVTPQRNLNMDHSTKLNIAAVPFIPSSLPATNYQKSATIISTATMTTHTIAATPSHKAIPAACYLPTAIMPTAPSMMPVIVPHPQIGSGYAISQQPAYPSVFPTRVPSHAYPLGTHPHSVVGLPCTGYPLQQPTLVPSAAVNSNVPGVRAHGGYNMFVPVTTSNIIPAANDAVHHAIIEQRKKEEKMKMLTDTKRFFEQNPSSSVAKQQPQLYKSATMATISGKQQLPVTTEGGRRTLLENPSVAMAPVMPHPPVVPMMSRPLELTAANNPLTGSKRKRRPPLIPFPQHLPTGAANNVTMTTLWDTPANTLY